MQVTETYYARHRDEWRKWLEKNHAGKRFEKMKIAPRL
jgi:hypothetical protein